MSDVRNSAFESIFAPFRQSAALEGSIQNLGWSPAIFMLHPAFDVADETPLSTALLATENRVEVDPNRFAIGSSTLTTAFVSDFTREPVEGETVVAVQPDEDDGDLTSFASVTEVDLEHGLVYLLVDWVGFRRSSPRFGLAGFACSDLVARVVNAQIRDASRPLSQQQNANSGAVEAKLTSVSSC